MTLSTPFALILGLPAAGLLAGFAYALLMPSYRLTQVGKDDVSGAPIVLKMNAHSGRVDICLVHELEGEFRYVIRCDGKRE